MNLCIVCGCSGGDFSFTRIIRGAIVRNKKVYLCSSCYENLFGIDYSEFKSTEIPFNCYFCSELITNSKNIDESVFVSRETGIRTLQICSDCFKSQCDNKKINEKLGFYS